MLLLFFYILTFFFKIQKNTESCTPQSTPSGAYNTGILYHVQLSI